MSFRIGKKEAPHVAIRRLLIEELDLALVEMDCAAGDEENSRALHEARRGIKKVRAILMLGKPVVGTRVRLEDRRLRFAARVLSRHRELDATLLVLEAETARLPVVDKEILRTAVRLHHHAHVRSTERNADLLRARTIVRALRGRIEKMSLFVVPQRALRRRFRKAYRAARKALAEARNNPTGETLHAWRKRTKLLLYETRLLRAMGEASIAELANSLSSLDDRLGHARDCLQLVGILRGLPAAYVPVKSGLGLNALLERASTDDHAGALCDGLSLFRLKSRSFVRRYLGT